MSVAVARMLDAWSTPVTDGAKLAVVDIWTWLDDKMLPCIVDNIGAMPPAGAHRAAASLLVSASVSIFLS